MSDDGGGGGADDAAGAAMVEFLGHFMTVGGVSGAPEKVSDLSDGVALFEALEEIAPDYFDPTTIARDLGSNWALKSSNLRKLVRNLETYYHDVLNKTTDFQSLVESIPGVARNADPTAIAALFELVAAAAVTCEDRGMFVGRIMDMSQEGQIEMKGIIERGMARLDEYDAAENGDEGGGVGSDEEEEGEVVFNDDAYGGYDSDEAERAMFMSPGGRSAGVGVGADDSGLADELESAMVNSAELEQLRSDLDDAKREIAAAKSQSAIQSEENESAQKKLRALAEDLQDRLARRQDELSQIETELSSTKRALEDAQHRATDAEEKCRVISDELDVANAKAQQLRKAEATVVAYRKKLEGVGVMNQQMTDMEDQTERYLRQIMDLEADVKKLPGLQKQVDELQMQSSKSEKEKAEADEALKSKLNEISTLRGDVAAAESAKRMYEEELHELRAQLEGSTDHDAHVAASPVSSGFTSARSVTEAKEKALRLEIENKTLKEEIEKLRSAPPQTVTVAAAAGSGGEDTAILRDEIARLKEELQRKEAEKAKLGSDKEKLEAYTKKTLSKFQEKYLVALQECKAKLKEKHDKIEALELRSAQEKNSQKREERLLSSTIYELGLAIMQQRLKDRS